MTQTVDMPLWALLLLIAFAGVTFASHFLFPSVRWFFRRRMERAVARLNERLERPIEPFKLARRYDMIQRLIYDPEVSRAIAEHARKQGIPENVAFEKAKGYAREIVPSFSATAYFGIAIRLAKWLSRSLYRVRLGHFDETLTGIDRDATVVFVMNHRSNMDYVLVTWLAAERSALSYAVGEWARVWPLSRLIKAMGAYFIRRKSRGALYRRVLARYVGMATDGGVTQAMFPEGGLSLNGGLQEPRLGLLKYLVEEREPGGRDVVFVPVALNYDRVFEDRLLVAADQSGGRRFPARISVVARFILRQGWLKLRGRYHRHGYAAVSFGAPMSLRAYQAEHPAGGVEGLARALMARIGAEVPVLPVPLV
uniref:1-acyl-sn-glycerol-3-phosphate acyltransferase n=1 Tax=uncultured Roseovarius sp. TaxID=293344 RepID=UPI00260C905F